MCIRDRLYPLQWQYPNINLPSAWNLTSGNGLAPIAILDTGRTLHPDLIGRWSSLEYNASSPGSSAIDVGNWHHATHVAGIAGAALNNGIGGTGVCPGCSLLNVKITYSNGSIDSAAIINGLNWATDHGARVVNMSFESAVACSASSPVSYTHLDVYKRQCDCQSLRTETSTMTEASPASAGLGGTNAVAW